MMFWLVGLFVAVAVPSGLAVKKLSSRSKLSLEEASETHIPSSYESLLQRRLERLVGNDNPVSPETSHLVKRRA